MAGVNVKSEIKPLKKVLLHRPGKELLNLTPNTLEELLFDDIPFLKVAQAEHDAFAQALRDNGVEVVYLENLMAEVLDANPALREQFLKQFIEEAGIRTERYQKILFDYLNDNYKTNIDLVLKCMEGVNLTELHTDKSNSLVDLVSESSKMVIAPMPNLYFTRDPFAMIGNGVSINRMYAVTRNRETIFAEYIFTHHPDFKDVPQYYSRYSAFHIEGGDILNINEHTLAIGISQRTEPDAIDMIARNIFKDETSPVDTILAFNIPNNRAMMHLDTVFTQIDVDKFTIHPGIMGPLTVFEITPLRVKASRSRRPPARSRKCSRSTWACPSRLFLALVAIVSPQSAKEWNDGSNTLCIAPGRVVVYERNDVTNALLRKNNIDAIEIPSAELSRGRGGPRCMSMPIWRED